MALPASIYAFANNRARPDPLPPALLRTQSNCSDPVSIGNPRKSIALSTQTVPRSQLVCRRCSLPDKRIRYELDRFIAAVSRHDHAPALRVEDRVHLCDGVDSVDHDRNKQCGTKCCQQIELPARDVQLFGLSVHACIVSRLAPDKQSSA